MLLHGELEHHDVSVGTELNGKLPAVSGDRAQLLQVLLNLIVNAVEAMASVTDRERVLRLRSDVDEARVSIVVEDSGTGVDPENLDRIFDAFFTTKPSGMGMGLSICRSIIEAHEGRLSAQPGERYGTVVRFTLPADRRAVA